jgi:hypothetical protein
MPGFLRSPCGQKELDMSLAVSSKLPVPTQQQPNLMLAGVMPSRTSGVPAALAGDTNRIAQFGRLSEEQKKALSNTLLLYPGARAADLVDATRTQSWNNAARQPSEANRRLGGLFRVVAMLSTTAAGKLTFLDKNASGTGVVIGGNRQANPTMREVARNTLNLILNDTIDLKVGSKSDLAKVCPAGARACARASTLYVSFTDVESKANIARDPIGFVPNIAHEASHVLDHKRLEAFGLGTKGTTLFADGLGYYVLAGEYKARYVGALATTYGLAAELRDELQVMRDRKDVYPQVHALLARNPAVRQLLERAMQAADAGNPMPVNTFISALGQLRSQEKVFGWGGPDAVEQKFFRFQHNDRNLWTR